MAPIDRGQHHVRAPQLLEASSRWRCARAPRRTAAPTDRRAPRDLRKELPAVARQPRQQLVAEIFGDQVVVPAQTLECDGQIAVAAQRQRRQVEPDRAILRRSAPPAPGWTRRRSADRPVPAGSQRARGSSPGPRSAARSATGEPAGARSRAAAVVRDATAQLPASAELPEQRGHDRPHGGAGDGVSVVDQSTKPSPRRLAAAISRRSADVSSPAVDHISSGQASASIDPVARARGRSPR